MKVIRIEQLDTTKAGGFSCCFNIEFTEKTLDSFIGIEVEKSPQEIEAAEKELLRLISQIQ